MPQPPAAAAGPLPFCAPWQQLLVPALAVTLLQRCVQPRLPSCGAAATCCALAARCCAVWLLLPAFTLSAASQHP